MWGKQAIRDVPMVQASRCLKRETTMDFITFLDWICRKKELDFPLLR
jgi:hypothetical protein